MIDIKETLAEIADMIETDYSDTHTVRGIKSIVSNHKFYRVISTGTNTVDFEFGVKRNNPDADVDDYRFRFTVFGEPTYKIVLGKRVGLNMVRQYLDWRWTGIKPVWWRGATPVYHWWGKDFRRIIVHEH